jgi:hypothetical protein
VGNGQSGAAFLPSLSAAAVQEAEFQRERLLLRAHRELNREIAEARLQRRNLGFVPEAVSVRIAELRRVCRGLAE